MWKQKLYLTSQNRNEFTYISCLSEINREAVKHRRQDETFEYALDLGSKGVDLAEHRVQSTS